MIMPKQIIETRQLLRRARLRIEKRFGRCPRAIRNVLDYDQVHKALIVQYSATSICSQQLYLASMILIPREKGKKPNEDCLFRFVVGLLGENCILALIHSKSENEREKVLDSEMLLFSIGARKREDLISKYYSYVNGLLQRDSRRFVFLRTGLWLLCEAGLWHEVARQAEILGIMDNASEKLVKEIGKTATRLMGFDENWTRRMVEKARTVLGVLLGISSNISSFTELPVFELAYLRFILLSIDDNGARKPRWLTTSKESGLSKDLRVNIAEAAWSMGLDEQAGIDYFEAARLAVTTDKENQIAGQPGYSFIETFLESKYFKSGTISGETLQKLSEAPPRSKSPPPLQQLFKLMLAPAAGISSWPTIRLEERRQPPEFGARLVCLRRWGSDTSLFDWSKEPMGNIGGGYFLGLGEKKGVVIDPGLDYLRAFYAFTPYSFHDIRYVLVSHSHIDHAGDLIRLMLVQGKINKNLAPGKKLQPINIIAPFDVFAPISDLTRDRNLCSKMHPIGLGRETITSQKCDCVRQCVPEDRHCPVEVPGVDRLQLTKSTWYGGKCPAPHEYETAKWLSVSSFSVQHLTRGITTFPATEECMDHSCGFDLIFEHLEKKYRIVYTGDAKAINSADITERRQDKRIDLLIANLGSVKFEELLGDNRESGSHLGLTKLIDLTVKLKPKVLLISELLHNLSFYDWRTDFRDIVQQKLDKNRKLSVRVPVFLAELGLSFIFENGEIHVSCQCSDFSGRYPLATIATQGKLGAKHQRNDRLVTFCPSCTLA